MASNFFWQRRKKVERIGTLVASAALALSLLGAAPTPPTPAVAHLQPQLAQLLAQKPAGNVRVIIQKATKNSEPEALVARAGGKVTMDLHIINAFSAEMPKSAVAEFSKDSNVRWVSLDSDMEHAGGVVGPVTSVNTGALDNVFTKVVKATSAWNTAPYFQGQNVGVAVVDSGVKWSHPDLGTSDVNGYGTSRVVASVRFNSYTNSNSDQYGHGTHVAGIIAGNGVASNGAYIGIAPRANIVNVKVSDDQGAATASDVVNGLQWVNDNKAAYNIKVVNLSLNQSVAESYMTNPIDAAVEILWFNGITVVVSAGNNGTATLFPPANDPFVITVGATDDHDTISLSDDTIAPFSAYGTTENGFRKPDLVAPGVHINGLLSSSGAVLAQLHPSAQVPGYSNNYFNMSGTSMAAPVVAGAAALILQKQPNLTPDQVKYRLKASANHDTTAFPAYNSTKMGSGLLNIQQAVNGTQTTASANTNIQASQLLWSGNTPVTWGSVNWNSVNWNSVNWNSVNWNSVNWNSVNWNSDWWGQ